MSDAEERVSKFYNSIGWETKDGIAEDTKRFEDLREHAQEYISKCRLRVLNNIPKYGENILDMASGPIQYKEYLQYSNNFKKRYCIDLSSKALEDAKNRIGNHGVFIHGSFFDIPLDENFFDCAISLHTIYHIDKDRQEYAVRKLIKVTKPEKPVIIVYSNPKTILPLLLLPYRILRKVKLLLSKKAEKKEEGFYSYLHPNKWWNRFEDIAYVKILPYQSFSSNIQKMIIPNNKIGSKMFRLLFNLEERFPNFFASHFQYPMIILTKKLTNHSADR